MDEFACDWLINQGNARGISATTVNCTIGQSTTTTTTRKRGKGNTAQ
jgi:hypothetical protein